MSWVIGGFRDDDAQRWVEQFTDEGLSAISEALTSLIEADQDELDESQCHAALAAVEVVAALLGEPSDDLPEEVQEWVEENEDPVDDGIRKKSASALERIEESGEVRSLVPQEDWGRFQSYLSHLKQRLEA
jgi:hypothetical protein